MIDRYPLFPAEKSLRSSEMESDGGHEAIQPVTAEEEALKRNTDCVYFLASPLTCKKVDFLFFLAFPLLLALNGGKVAVFSLQPCLLLFSLA